VDPGDEVVVLEPYYDSYTAMIQIAGGLRRPVTLRAPAFRLDVDELRAVVGPRTRFLLLNSPHNPTGTVLTREELRAVADVAIDHDLVVITDEVYEHLTFAGHDHVPLATLPGMFERTLTLSSAGKSYSVTGWKVGWATGPTDLVAATLAAKQWLTFTSGAPLQPAVARALDEEPDWPRRLAVDLQRRRDLLCDGLAALGLDVRRPEGTYFALTDISTLGWADGMEFCLALPERAGVVAIPAQPFHDSDAGDQLVRWAFCKEASVIEEALTRLGDCDLNR
jgi:N-succinyldiaminopimelate aminotransferase